MATALLARVYLYQEKWDSAEIESSTLIDDTNFSLESDLNNVFRSTTKEAIWQLEPPGNGFNAPDGVFGAGYVINGRPTSTYPFLLQKRSS